MRLYVNQIEAIKQEAGNFHGAAQARLSGRRVSDNQCGFTMVELIMTMVIIGILAAVVAPRLLDTSVFQSRGFADQVQASLRYAQKQAIAQRRNVCVTMTANDIILTIAGVSGPLSPCDTNLVSPAGQPSNCPSATYRICAPSGITLTYSSANSNFDALGRTAANTISVSGATNSIVVEAETGYVHSP